MNNMFLATENINSKTVPMSPIARTTPIESITLVPTAGETSPTSVVVDATASCSHGVSELKRIQGYSNQLLIPEEMMYGNDLIMVWNIDDERQVNNKNRMDITLKEEATYNKAATTYNKEEDTCNKVATTYNKAATTATIIEALKKKRMSTSVMMEVDDVVDSKPPTSYAQPVSVPGTTNTVFLNSSIISFDEEEQEEETKPPNRQRRMGHHRRSHSHFNFCFR